MTMRGDGLTPVWSAVHVGGARWDEIVKPGSFPTPTTFMSMEAADQEIAASRSGDDLDAYVGPARPLSNVYTASVSNCVSHDQVWRTKLPRDDGREGAAR